MRELTTTKSHTVTNSITNKSNAIFNNVELF
jgi:hypothetical protein